MNINRRPPCFFGPFDITITNKDNFARRQHYFIGSTSNMLKHLGEHSDINAYDNWAARDGKNTYADFLLTSLCIVAEQTSFINEGSRFMGGQYKEGYDEHNCHLLFTVGFRGELKDTPEYNTIVTNGAIDVAKYTTRCQLTFNLIKDYVRHNKDNGTKNKVVCLTGLGIGVWAVKTALQQEIFLRVAVEVFKDEDNLEVLYLGIDAKNYDGEMKALITKQTSITDAMAHGGKVDASELAKAPGMTAMDANVINETADDEGKLDVAEMEAYLGTVNSELEEFNPFPSAILTGGTWKVSERNNGNTDGGDNINKPPGQLVNDNSANKYYYHVFAGDGNSYRGNEGLLGFNTQSGDPQYVINSRLPVQWERTPKFLQNGDPKVDLSRG